MKISNAEIERFVQAITNPGPPFNPLKMARERLKHHRQALIDARRSIAYYEKAIVILERRCKKH